jgi:hypothetical protein
VAFDYIGEHHLKNIAQPVRFALVEVLTNIESIGAVGRVMLLDPFNDRPVILRSASTLRQCRPLTFLCDSTHFRASFSSM